jgi:hypothetical protein
MLSKQDGHATAEYNIDLIAFSSLPRAESKAPFLSGKELSIPNHALNPTQEFPNASWCLIAVDPFLSVNVHILAWGLNALQKSSPVPTRSFIPTFISVGYKRSPEIIV